MPKSTNLIGDATSVITNGPSATTTANAIAAAGPIMDYIALTRRLLARFTNAQVSLGLTIGAITEGIKGVTDSTDATNLALINGILALLTGGGSPSTQALTDMQSVITNGPNAATQAKALAAAGEIMDYVGNCKLVLLMLQEASALLGPTAAPPSGLIVVTAVGDDSTNKTLLQNLKLALV